jgi:hypothetical protein
VDVVGCLDGNKRRDLFEGLRRFRRLKHDERIPNEFTHCERPTVAQEVCLVVIFEMEWKYPGIFTDGKASFFDALLVFPPQPEIISFQLSARRRTRLFLCFSLEL